MPLDFAILDSDAGAPELQVSLWQPEHVELMDRALEGKSPLLRRLEDFYADTEFVPAELPALLREVDEVALGQRTDLQLGRFLDEFRALIRVAIEREVPVYALAD